jgi:hypothetical protein
MATILQTMPQWLLWMPVATLACCGLSASDNSAGAEQSRDPVPAGPVERIAGDQGLKPLYYPKRDQRAAAVLDLSAATFLLNNSSNSNPTKERDCKTGDLPTNKQPLNLFSAPGLRVKGGLIRGTVPLGSDWQYTYCNSAAVNLRQSPRVTVDGIRIGNAWDGIRVGQQSDDFVVRNAWLSDVRDDGVENDHLLSGRIENSLFDGLLQAVALMPNKAVNAGPSRGTLTINASLFLSRDDPFRGRQRFGSLAKSDQRAPALRIQRSIIAIDSASGTTWPEHWANGWAKMQYASDNLLLWLSDRPVPTTLPLPRTGFRIVTGAQARAIWKEARQNWINCHPQVARLPGDPPSRPGQCRTRNFGGSLG